MNYEIIEYLYLNGYANLDEWGHDSDYVKTEDGWFDEYGNRVDLEVQIAGALESLANA